MSVNKDSVFVPVDEGYGDPTQRSRATVRSSVPGWLPPARGMGNIVTKQPTTITRVIPLPFEPLARLLGMKIGTPVIL